MPTKSLYRRLFLSYLWIAALAVLIVGAFGVARLRRFYLDTTASRLEACARLCAQRTGDLLRSGTPGAVDELCKTWGGAISTRITVILPDGTVAGDSEEDPAVMDDHSGRPEVVEARETGSTGRATRFSDTQKVDRMYVAVLVDAEGESGPRHFVRASLPLEEVQETVTAIQHQAIITALAAAGLTAVVSLWFSMRLTRH